MSTPEVKSNGSSAASAGQQRQPDPCVVVIFGASGDLTKRKLLPALYHLEQQGLLPEQISVVGVARRPLEQSFPPDMRDGILAGGGVAQDEAKLASFIEKVRYFAMNFDDDKGYAGLNDLLGSLDEKQGTKGNRLFYLATAPEYFADIVNAMGRHGMNKPSADKQGSWVRVIIEKPFGHDLQSARALNDDVNKVFGEDQIFRIDHYLGKETVQNILPFRFANTLFEKVWNRESVDHVQITAAESIGIEGRGPFYEQAGLLRDVMQNHVMEMVSVLAMEPPATYSSDTVRAEKIKLWKAITPPKLEDTVRGQYGPGKVDGKDVAGYRQEERVNPESQTETYAALRLAINNERWRGVPFYLRAGKRLAKRTTEITVQLKAPAGNLFPSAKGNEGAMGNTIVLRIQPNEGISIQFGAKIPGPTMMVGQEQLQFSYADAFGSSSANGYEPLLLDAMLGDGTLFTHRDGVEATWALMTPILELWKHNPASDLPNYAAGSWGPEAADALLAADGRKWRNS